MLERRRESKFHIRLVAGWFSTLQAKITNRLSYAVFLDEEICRSLLEAFAKGVMAGAMLWPVARLNAEFIFSYVSYCI